MKQAPDSAVMKQAPLAVAIRPAWRSSPTSLYRAERHSAHSLLIHDPLRLEQLMISHALKQTVRGRDWHARSRRCHAGDHPRSGTACAYMTHRPQPPPRATSSFCSSAAWSASIAYGHIEPARTPSLRGETAASVRDDLLQRLILHLWSVTALRDDEAWELVFSHALSFAQWQLGRIRCIQSTRT